MSRPKSFGFPIAALLALASLTGSIRAQDLSARQTALAPRAFQAATRMGETIGWEQTRRVFITCGTNEFVFVVPQGLRVEVNPDKVSLVSADSTYFITFRILKPADAEAPASGDIAARAFLVNQFPEARVLAEFSRTAANRTGPALELQFIAVGKIERTACATLIPSAAGMLEFCLNADVSKYPHAEPEFNSLLRTFGSNEQGKLEVVTRTTDNS